MTINEFPSIFSIDNLIFNKICFLENFLKLELNHAKT